MAPKMYRGSSDLPKQRDLENTHHMQLYSNCMFCNYSTHNLSQWGAYLGKQSATTTKGVPIRQVISLDLSEFTSCSE